jgi:uncharacterized protein YjdB
MHINILNKKTPQLDNMKQKIVLLLSILCTTAVLAKKPASNTNSNESKTTLPAQIKIENKEKATKQNFSASRLISFTENVGQIKDQHDRYRNDIQFTMSANAGLSIFFGSGEIHYQFSKMISGVDKTISTNYKHNENTRWYDMYRMDVELIGANKNAAVIRGNKTEYFEHYFTDWSSKKGTTAYSYNKITYKNIYPKIDWVLYVKDNKLKHEFVVHEGGNANDIKLKYGGAEKLNIDNKGSLVATTKQGVITEQTPISFGKDGKRIGTRFVLNNNELGYKIDEYNGELTIDPAIGWASYYGGSGDDRGKAIAPDKSDNMYMGGLTASSANIATSGAYQTTYGGTSDGFITKFTSMGTRLWATYFGGSGTDVVDGIKVDPMDTTKIYFTGSTASTSGIATSGAFQTAHGGSTDGYLARIDNNGNLIWATYYGDTGNDSAKSVVVDYENGIYIAGMTNSASNIASGSAHQTTIGGSDDAFIAKFDSSGNRIWATYYGGTGADVATAMNVDIAGNILMTGITGSTAGIATSGTQQTTKSTGNDCMIVKFRNTGVLAWGTYYGGTGEDRAQAIASSPLDSVSIFVVGQSNSSGLATAGAQQTSNSNPNPDALIVKFNSAGVRQWATYLGGPSNTDYGTSAAVDSAGVLFVVGYTNSTANLTTADALQPAFSGTGGAAAFDLIVQKYNGSGAGTRIYGSFYGGTQHDQPHDIAIDKYSNVYMTGYTTSTAGIATSGAYQTTHGGGTNDAFIIKYSFGPTIIGTQSVCIAGTQTLSATISGGTWSSTNSAVGTISSGGVVTGIAAGTTTISYVTGAGTATIVFSVNGTPSAGTITGSSTACISGTTTLANATTGGTWSSTNLATATVGSSSGVVQGVAAGTVTITYTVTTACGTGYTSRVMTVSTTPTVAAITGSTTICSGTTSTYTNATSGGTWSSSSAGVGSINSATGVLRGLTSGAYTISYTVSGCTNVSATKAISGFLTPSMGVSVGSATSCVGSATTYTATPTTGYTWSSSNTAVATINTGGNATAVASGTTSISYVHNTAGCYATATLSVNASPTVNITTSVCAGATQTATVSPTGGTWASSNTSVGTIDAATGVFTGSSSGSTNISYTLSGCRTITAVSVTGLPAAITGITSVCQGSTSELSSGTASQTWSSSNTSVATITTLNTTTAEVSGTATGTSLISYTNSAGCYRVVTVTVTSPMTANTGDALVCIGQSSTLSNSTASGAWTSSDVAKATVNSSTGVVTAVATGTTNITYSTTSPSSCQTSTQVTVNAAIPANTGTASVCAGLTTTLSNATTGGTWSSNNANVSVDVNTGVVTGVTAGTSVLTYLFSSGCYKTNIVTINPVPAAIAGTFVICEGTTTTLTNSTGGGTWISSNAAVGTIGSSSGTVAAISGGTTIITYRLSATGCQSTKEFTVNSLPSTISGTLLACTGITNTLSATPAGGTWSSSNTAVATIGSSDGSITGSTAGTSNITYTLATGCKRTAIATVNTTPVAIAGTFVLCEGSATTLTNSTVGGSWISSNTAVGTIGSATGIVAAISDGTTTISYQIITTGCYATQTFTTNPLPASITGSLSVCEGSTTALSTASTGGTWSSSNTAVATIGTNGVVAAVAVGTSNITYSLPTGCIRSTTVTVNPTPVAIAGTFAICEATTTTLTNATGSGEWISSNTAVATIGSATGLVTGAGGGTTTISYMIATTGCKATQVFTVNPLPGAITGSLVVCAGSDNALGNTLAGGTWVSSVTAVATIGSSSGLLTGVAAGTSDITYTTTGGCYVTVTITVNAQPSVTGLLSICDGTSTTLSATPSGGTWQSSDVVVATIGSLSGIVTGETGGNATISYTDLNSCTRTVQVTVIAALATNIAGPAGVCIGHTVTMSHAVTGGTWTCSDTTKATIDASTGVITGLTEGSVTITYSIGTTCYRTKTVAIQYQPVPITGSTTICNGSYTVLYSTIGGSGTWSSADTTVAAADLTSGMITGMSTGTTTITYKIPFSGCMVATTVTVDAAPTAITGGPFVCQGTSVALGSTPSGGTWTSSNTGVATIDTATGVTSGISAGVTMVSYTLSTGCRVTLEVSVNNMPAALTGNMFLCPAGTTTLVSTTAGGTWFSSNTAVATISSGGVVTPVSLGTTTITYTLGTGCLRTAEVTVTAAPAASTGPNRVCVGATALLSNATAGGTWMSSNTAKATVVFDSGLVTGIATGTANITYTAAGPGCYTTSQITIDATPAAITGTLNACVGFTSTLSHTTSGGTWSSSNTAIATVDAGTGVITAVAAGYATITYQTTPSCFVTTAFNSKALPAVITGNPYACVGTTTVLANTVSAGTWSSSNTANATIHTTSGTLTGVATGIATITYKLATGCYRTTEVSVNAAPAAITGVNAVCLGSTAVFSCTPTGGTWLSGTPATATIDAASGTVTAVAAGTTRITYTQDITGCRSSKTVTVGVTPAAITGILTTCEGSTTTLADATTGGTWSSSDLAVATIGSVTRIATGISAGTATISYNHSGGCVATAVLTVIPAVGSSTGDPNLCVGGKTTLTNAAGGGTWSSSTTAKATVGSATGIVSGVAAGTAVISYKVTAACYSTKIVTVAAAPAAITGTANVCIGANITLTHATSGGTWSSSNPAIGSIDATTGVVTGIAVGTISVSYVVSNGCFTTKTINVNNLPPAISGTMAVCEAATSALTCVIGGSATWSSSNTAVGTIGATSGMLAGVTAGTTIITYRLNTTGCYSTREATINALPSVITGSNTICVGSTQAYSSTTGGGTWSSSNATIAAIGSASGVATGGTGGSASLSYTIANGCRRVKPVTINVLPATITGTTKYCVGGTATLTCTTAGGTWSSDAVAATVAIGGVVTATTAGTSLISYTLGTGCARTVTVTVNAALDANTGNNSICVGGTTALANSTTGGTWSSSTAAKASVGSSSGIVTGVATGTSNISYSVTGAGCYSITQVTVNAAIAAITGTANACIGSTSTLSHTAAGGTWSSSNTALATVDGATGVVTAVAAGTPFITYTATPGCIKTTAFTVKTLPTAIGGAGSVCTASAIVLTGSPTGGSWSSSSTATAVINSLTGAMTGISAGTVSVTYRGSNGCSISTVRTVNAAPAAITGTFTAAVGATRTLLNATPSGVWSSSNSSIASVAATTGVVSGITTGSALITYSLANGCFKSATFTVTAAKGVDATIDEVNTFTVYPNPTAGNVTIESSLAGTFSLIAMDGRVVAQYEIAAAQHTISLPAALAAGTYMGRFTLATGEVVVMKLYYQP